MSPSELAFIVFCMLGVLVVIVTVVTVATCYDIVIAWLKRLRLQIAEADDAEGW